MYAWPMVEYRGIGYFFTLSFIKLQNMDEKKEKEFFDFLNNYGYIPIIMRGQGYADVIIAIDGKGIHHVAKIMNDINAKFSVNILDMDIVIPIGFSRFNRNYLVGKVEETKQIAFTGAPVKKEIDKIDRKVLSMINYNARVSLKSIANKINISYESAYRRIKKLEETGVIQCYTILIDHVKIGYPRHRTLIKFKNITPEWDKKFYKFCNMHPNIIHHLRVLGNWDLVIDIEVESLDKLRKILQEIKLKFHRIIKRIEPTYIYKIDQFRDIPVEYPELNVGFWDE